MRGRRFVSRVKKITHASYYSEFSSSFSSKVCIERLHKLQYTLSYILHQHLSTFCHILHHHGTSVLSFFFRSSRSSSTSGSLLPPKNFHLQFILVDRRGAVHIGQFQRPGRHGLLRVVVDFVVETGVKIVNVSFFTPGNGHGRVAGEIGHFCDHGDVGGIVVGRFGVIRRGGFEEASFQCLFAPVGSVLFFPGCARLIPYRSHRCSSSSSRGNGSGGARRRNICATAILRFQSLRLDAPDQLLFMLRLLPIEIGCGASIAGLFVTPKHGQFLLRQFIVVVGIILFIFFVFPLSLLAFAILLLLPRLFARLFFVLFLLFAFLVPIFVGNCFFRRITSHPPHAFILPFLLPQFLRLLLLPLPFRPLPRLTLLFLLLVRIQQRSALVRKSLLQSRLLLLLLLLRRFFERHPFLFDGDVVRLGVQRRFQVGFGGVDVAHGAGGDGPSVQRLDVGGVDGQGLGGHVARHAMLLLTVAHHAQIGLQRH
mmetsp:Transcript_3769/g.7064  ORF Transcript_3769/g.7064 Transcript_3769/m.7064 type:complete len:482 (-) Transcript_3769:625-2070(-)